MLVQWCRRTLASGCRTYTSEYVQLAFFNNTKMPRLKSPSRCTQSLGCTLPWPKRAKPLGRVLHHLMAAPAIGQLTLRSRCYTRWAAVNRPIPPVAGSGAARHRAIGNCAVNQPYAKCSRVSLATDRPQQLDIYPKLSANGRAEGAAECGLIVQRSRPPISAAARCAQLVDAQLGARTATGCQSSPRSELQPPCHLRTACGPRSAESRPAPKVAHDMSCPHRPKNTASSDGELIL
jgi:hypothetical protein